MSPLDVLRVLVGAPLFLIIPGYLLLLPLAPRWSHIPRAVVGATITIALVSLASWGWNALAGKPFDAANIRGIYLALTLIAVVVAYVGRTQWWPLAIPRVEPKHFVLSAIVIGGALFLASPRWNYAYPFHVDEWWPFAAGFAMERQATVNFVDPRLGLWPYMQNPEVGFHLFVTTLRYLTGADWLTLFRLGPVVVGGLTIVAAWAAGDREGYGAEAALLVALLPTSLRVLGPQYFVPLALGFLFIPAAFLLFTNPHPKRTLPLLLFLLVFLFFTHPQSAVAVGILIGTYALLAFPRGWRTSVALIAIAAVPVVLGLLLLKQHVDSEKLLAAESALPVPEFIALFGILPAILFLAGVQLTILRPSAERLAWVTTSFVHLLLVTLFLLWKIGQPNLYDRAWMHGILTMSFTAAYALYRLRTAAFWGNRLSIQRAATGAVAFLLVATATTAQAERSRDYYEVIDDEEYADFVWIRDNIETKGARALIYPWQGTAFSTITGMNVVAAFPYSIGSPTYNGSDMRGYNNVGAADKALRTGASDMRLLDKWNVTLIYSAADVKNANFTEVHPNVYLRANLTTKV